MQIYNGKEMENMISDGDMIQKYEIDMKSFIFVLT
jgi:hypothetical protein